MAAACRRSPAINNGRRRCRCRSDKWCLLANNLCNRQEGPVRDPVMSFAYSYPYSWSLGCELISKQSICHAKKSY
jgi:hypothetical protein